MQRLLHDFSQHPITTALYCLGILLAIGVALLLINGALIGAASIIDRFRKR